MTRKQVLLTKNLHQRGSTCSLVPSLGSAWSKMLSRKEVTRRSRCPGLSWQLIKSSSLSAEERRLRTLVRRMATRLMIILARSRRLPHLRQMKRLRKVVAVTIALHQRSMIWAQSMITRTMATLTCTSGVPNWRTEGGARRIGRTNAIHHLQTRALSSVVTLIAQERRTAAVR